MFLNGAMERPQYRNAPTRKQTKKMETSPKYNKTDT